MTAQKRVEKVQDVPTSITVASGRQLVQSNVTTANDVERLTPNLSGQQSSGRQSRARWFLRGIGTNDPSLNLESPIGFYQDEVFVAYSLAQTFPLFDLERVEILKGPQGTLWGKNTTGGALHFISKRPSFTASGYTKGTIGSYGQRAIEGGFGGPVAGEWLAARASFFYESLEGWATNLRDDSKAPDYSDAAARLQLLANVTDDLDILLSARLRTLSGGTNAAYPIGTLPGGEIQQNPMNPDTYTPVYGKHPQIKDPFFAGPTSNSLITKGATATINWHLGDYTLTSISAVDTVDDNSNSLQLPAGAQLQSHRHLQRARLTADQPGAAYHLSARRSPELDRRLSLLQLEPVQRLLLGYVRPERAAQVVRQQSLPAGRHQLRRLRQRDLQGHESSVVDRRCSLYARPQGC